MCKLKKLILALLLGVALTNTVQAGEGLALPPDAQAGEGLALPDGDVYAYGGYAIRQDGVMVPPVGTPRSGGIRLWGEQMLAIGLYSLLLLPVLFGGILLRRLFDGFPAAWRRFLG
jgi:hypothetical protein